MPFTTRTRAAEAEGVGNDVHLDFLDFVSRPSAGYRFVFKKRQNALPLFLQVV